MARSFNGTTDRLDFANIANPAGLPLTISMWVYLNTYTGFRILFGVWNSTNDARAMQVVLYGSDTDPAYTIQFNRYRATSPFSRLGQANALSHGAWRHICITDPGTLSDYTACHIFVNGVDVCNPTSGPSNQTGSGTEVAGTGLWSLGNRYYTDLGTDGKLAEVGVWNRVIGASEISALAAGFSPRFMPGGLIWAPPLLGYDAEIDPISGKVATHDGTAKADHPRIIYPNSGMTVFCSIPSGGSAIPVISQYYARMRAA